MSVVRVILLMLRLMAARGDGDLAYRTELAAAVVAVTDNVQEQNILTTIARWESSFRRDVGECRKRGPQGERGAWQILARGEAEASALCVSLEGDARIALARVRESVSACAALPPAERLAVYTRGRCSSAEGRRMSRLRWAGGEP